VPADKLIKAVRGTDKELIVDAHVFDVYKGKGLPDGHKSLALSVTVQPKDKSLTDAEIEALSQKIVAAVTKATGATLRG
jgi:phenylalanyl-tRNA synthetase beta chain